ncbi:MAG: tRNA lysidine(34) synthetase TilS [Bacteroidales bacterium]|jgi:tRNA(Ile)-lysidine synthase
MIDEFKRFISENNLIKPGDKILLAVSGGIDSMVMAHLFRQQDYKIGIAHCNFSLRASESDKDEDLVRQFASDHHIPFYSTRFETKSFAKKNRLSVQMAARDLRYNWFEEVRMKNGYDSIAVAHNLNDNIETLLINLIRGTGLTGMTGMKPLSNRIIRPLLFATRKDILTYRNQHKIIFREDKSNADTKYTRNKIRHLIIPVLKEINPSIEITLNETAERFSGLNEIVSDYISRLKESISEEKEEFITFNINQLKTFLHNKAVLFELFKPYGITNALLIDLMKVIEGKTGGQIITDTHRIIKNRNEIIVSDEEIRNETRYIIKNEESFCNFPGISSVRNVRITETFEIPSDPHIACIDSQKVIFPMTIRKWKAGDHFYPLGMKQKKKLSDYFIDKKYSRFDKENIFILESDGKIVWIIGDRIDDRFKITKSTKKGLLIKSKRKALIIKPVK